MTTAIIYTRYSPQRDGEEKESCQTQEDTCRQYAQRKGYEVAAVFDDPEASGGDEYREKLWQAIKEVPRGGVLIVYKRDRLARNVYLSEQINRAVASNGGRIEAVTGDVAGEGPEVIMLRQVLASIHEYERKLIAARTSHAMKWHLTQGHCVSRFPPYGWQIDPNDDRPVNQNGKRVGVKRMIVNPEEQAVVEEIRTLCSAGFNPYRICQALNSSGVKSRGTMWRPKSVMKILARGKE